MLVRDALVKTTGRFRILDPAYFLDLGGVGETGYVEDHGAQIVVRAAHLKLGCDGHVVPAVSLHVGRVECPGPAVDIRVFDGPMPEHVGLCRILELDDVEATGREATAYICVRPRELLLHLDIARPSAKALYVRALKLRVEQRLSAPQGNV